MFGGVRDSSQQVNLYEVLEIDRIATQDEIKRQYKQLAMKFHPDKNPAGADRFKEITQAYRILSDPEQRSAYDCNRKKVSWSDLEVELTPEDLREFVSDLIRTERDEEAKRKDFEQRREEEMRRRAEFEAAHPNFKMRSVNVEPMVRIRSSSGSEPQEKPKSARTSPLRDEMLAKTSAADPPEVAANYVGYTPGVGSAYKQQMLQKFRQQRETGPSSSGVVWTKSGLASQGPFLTDQEGNVLSDTDVIKKAHENFDFLDYVNKRSTYARDTKAEKERMADIILADSLKGYGTEGVTSLD